MTETPTGGDVSMSFTVTIDNHDRAQAPDMAWTATTDHDFGTSGVGATPAAALADLADAIASLVTENGLVQ